MLVRAWPATGVLHALLCHRPTRCPPRRPVSHDFSAAVPSPPRQGPDPSTTHPSPQVMHGPRLIRVRPAGAGPGPVARAAVRHLRAGAGAVQLAAERGGARPGGPRLRRRHVQPPHPGAAPPKPGPDPDRVLGRPGSGSGPPSDSARKRVGATWNRRGCSNIFFVPRSRRIRRAHVSPAFVLSIADVGAPPSPLWPFPPPPPIRAPIISTSPPSSRTRARPHCPRAFAPGPRDSDAGPTS